MATATEEKPKGKKDAPTDEELEVAGRLSPEGGEEGDPGAEEGGEGRSIADAAANGDEGTQEEFIEGARQLSLLAGGEQPTSSSMKLRGGAIAVEGEFEKGDILRLVLEVRVSEVHFVDTVDAHGYVTRTERRHIGRTESITRA